LTYALAGLCRAERWGIAGSIYVITGLAGAALFLVAVGKTWTARNQ
jgi:uncharacterized membrane protein YuzA (DUF378 family)